MTDDGTISTDAMPDHPVAPSRRLALGKIGGAAGGLLSTLAVAARAQAPSSPLRIPTPPPALVPRADLVDVLEYEAQARRVIGPARLAPVVGSDRSVTDRITLRPRMNIPTRDLDMTCTLFGDEHFAPIIIGPVADQKRFHPEGEVATVRGASAAKAAIVVGSDSSVPLATVAAALTTPLYVQLYAGNPRTRDLLAAARAAMARAVFVTVNAGTSAGAPAAPAGARIDWAAVDAVVKNSAVPVIVKGITRPEDAREAIARGAKGIVVSNYRGGGAAALPGTLLLIAPIVEAVGGRVPVLVDGSFRRGTDIVKALGFGAKAVLIGRPAMWGLAAYGADGVRGVVEMLQTETARYMAMCGRPTLAAVDASLVRVHAPMPMRNDHV